MFFCKSRIVCRSRLPAGESSGGGGGNRPGKSTSLAVMYGLSESENEREAARESARTVSNAALRMDEFLSQAVFSCQMARSIDETGYSPEILFGSSVVSTRSEMILWAQE